MNRGNLELFRVAFYFQNWINELIADSSGNARESILIKGVVEGIHQEGEFDLTVEVFEGKKGLLVNFKYNPRLFEEETIRRTARHYEEILKNVVARPDKRISEMCLLTDEEESRILVEWNDTAAEYPDKCVHELITEQAERTPNNIAVSCGENHLMYAELDRKATQLARYLSKKYAKMGAEALYELALGHYHCLSDNP